MNSKKSLIVLVIAFILMSTLFFVSPAFINSIGSTSAPKMEIFPNNTYKETLHVVADIDYEPYTYVLDDGSYAGHDVELISEIANELHMNLDLKLMPWDDAINAVRDKKADVVMGADVITDDTDSNMLMTIPLADDMMTVFGKKDVESAGALYGSRIAVIKENGAMAILKSYMLDSYCTYYDTYTEAFQSVESDKNDFVISNFAVGNVIIRSLGSKDIKSTGVSIMQNHFCFGVREDKPELLDNINTELVKLSSDGEINRLQDKWVGNREKLQSMSDFFKEHLLLVILYVAGVFVLLVAYLTYTVVHGRRREKLLTHQAETDPLTGLANRASAENMIRRVLLDRSSHDRHALFIIDIDNFKGVNDVYGHQKGDQVLQSIAEVLQKSFRETDVIGRLGGDEFFVFVENVQDNTAIEYKAGELCSEIAENFGKDLGCDTSISIGIAFYPDDGSDFAELYSCADAALYQTKNHGKNGYVVYNEKYSEHSSTEITPVDDRSSRG